MKTEIIAVISAVLIVSIALGIVKYQEGKIERQAREITRLNVELAQADKALVVCNNEIATQNEAIEAMAVDTEAAKLKYQETLAAASVEYDAIRRKLNVELAKNPNCENERELINEQLCLFMGGCL